MYSSKNRPRRPGEAVPVDSGGNGPPIDLGQVEVRKTGKHKRKKKKGKHDE